jgi:flagellar M-ring protein FliF
VTRLNQLGNRARTMLAGFTLGQRAVVVVAVLGLVLGAMALSRWVAQPTWAPLFTNLTGSDANAIVTELGTEGVQYQLANQGTTVLVPQAQVYSLRITLQGKGLPANTGATGGNSYSVLDSQGMTATDFQQNIAYQRALENELAKTLEAISGVNTAIVHLAIPKQDVFTTTTDVPTAAVLVALAPGTTLSREQVRSIMHLVAGSVPSLNPSDVTVTDSTGAMLSVREDGTAGAGAAASENDLQTQQFEDAKSQAVQKILDTVLGAGHAVVRVNAELNFDNTDTTSTTYVTQSGVSPLSQATSSESYNAGVAGAGGALGQTFPTLTPGLAAGAGGGAYVKVDSTVNNAVGEVVGRTQTAPGGVKRLTVAVVLDARTAAGIDPVQVQQLVANAVGLNPSRGDTVQVNKLAFDTSVGAAAAKELAAAQSTARTAQYLDLGKKAGLGLLVLIIALIAMRRRTKDAPAVVEATASDLPPFASGGGMLSMAPQDQLALSASAIQALGEVNSDVLDPTLERERLLADVAKFVDQQPEDIAAIVQGWLGQRKS